jgi:hypothetical protein
MTLSTSAVVVCCCSDTRSSLSRLTPHDPYGSYESYARPVPPSIRGHQRHPPLEN